MDEILKVTTMQRWIEQRGWQRLSVSVRFQSNIGICATAISLCV